jgi:hypothetical protein
MSHPGLNLTARDFDAYTAEKATSNAYSRPRLEVKQRALAWARGVVARLAALGIAVDVEGSDEHPSLRNKKRVDCQWVFFWRSPAARDELDRLLEAGRSIAEELDEAVHDNGAAGRPAGALVPPPGPYTRHAFLALRIDAGAVDVCFAVPPRAKVDADNLRARLADGAEALTRELTAALAALPEQFAIGVAPEDRVPASSAAPEAIRAMIDRAAAGGLPLWIGWSVGRDTAVAHADILDEQLEDAIIALAPIYRLVAWARDNDHIALDRRMESVVEERARAHAAAEAETERWRAEQAEARQRAAEQARERAVRDEDARRGASTPPRRPSLDALFSGLPPRGARPPKAEPQKPPRSRPAEPPAPPPRAPRPAAPSAEAPAAPPASPVQASATAEIEKGGKVRVLSGPFADKIGVVGELDGRGGARVLLGLLSTRLDLAELEPVVEGRERPAMQSSHRRVPSASSSASPRAPLMGARGGLSAPPAPRKSR